MDYEISSSIRDNQGRGKVGDFLKDKIQPGSKLSTVYCPHCRTVTNLGVSITPRIITEPARKEKIISSKTCHCKSCRSFVRGE